MKFEWKKTKVLDLGEIITGKTPKTSIAENYNGSIPFLTPSDNMDSKYVTITSRTLSQLGLAEVSKKILPPNSVCVSCIGSDLGKVTITTQPTVTNQQINSIIVNTKKYDVSFVYYAMKILGQKLNFISKTSTAVPIVNKSAFSEYEIECPPIDQQHKIAALLSSFDNKIELNNRINDNLEQQAQALFKSWFVDFEPFCGIKPDNWITSILGDVTVMSAGGDKPKTISEVCTNEFPYPIYSNGLNNEGLYGFTDIPKIKQESVTVSARGTIGFVCLRHIPYVPIVRLVTLIPKKEILSSKYLYLYLKQLNITGTGTTQQQLTVPDFRKTEILVPTPGIVERFTNIVEVLFDKIWMNQAENEHLICVRDTLLPKLMSGEIDVSDIEIKI